MVLFQVQLLFWDVFDSQEMWGERHSEEEWMCWCLEENIQYPRVTVLHAWISLSEQEQGRYRTGQEGVGSKTGNRNTERKIKGFETPAREVVLENYFYLLIQPLNHWRCRTCKSSGRLKMRIIYMKLRPPAELQEFKLGFFCLCFASRLTIHLGDTHQTQVMPATSSPLLWELSQSM